MAPVPIVQQRTWKGPSRRVADRLGSGSAGERRAKSIQENSSPFSLWEKGSGMRVYGAILFLIPKVREWHSTTNGRGKNMSARRAAPPSLPLRELTSLPRPNGIGTGFLTQPFPEGENRKIEGLTLSMSSAFGTIKRLLPEREGAAQVTSRFSFTIHDLPFTIHRPMKRCPQCKLVRRMGIPP